VRPLAADQQPATKADLYAAVDAMRADMRELMEHVRELIQVADKRVSDLEPAQGNLSTAFGGLVMASARLSF
jgi:hypothetical protein